jgi:hypothetical protein
VVEPNATLAPHCPGAVEIFTGPVQEIVAGVLMVISTTFVDIVFGLEALTLILYPDPGVVPAGIVAMIVPLALPARVPIFVGLEKLPDALLSWAVNTFPLLKLSLIIKLTFMEVPTHAVETTGATTISSHETTTGIDELAPFPQALEPATETLPPADDPV